MTWSSCEDVVAVLAQKFVVDVFARGVSESNYFVGWCRDSAATADGRRKSSYRLLMERGEGH